MASCGFAWIVSCIYVGIRNAKEQHSRMEGGVYSSTKTNLSRVTREAEENCCGAVSRVLIIRHCDKDGSSRRHCSARGYRRADWLPTLFAGSDKRWQTPDRLYACAPGAKHHVVRSVETLEPLSSTIAVAINQNYSAKTVDGFIDHLVGVVESGELCNKLALVSWKHEQIPYIVQRLGYTPTGGHRKKSTGAWSWKGSDFDTVVDLNFTINSYTLRWQVSGNLEHEGFVDD